jgi:hypothetical protein
MMGERGNALNRYSAHDPIFALFLNARLPLCPFDSTLSTN